LIRGLIPDRKYTVVAHGEGIHGKVLVDVVVKAEETTDVGNVKVQEHVHAADATLPKPSRSVSDKASTGRTVTKRQEKSADVKQESAKARGLVIVSADGLLVQKAKVWVREPSSSTWFSLTEMMDGGRIFLSLDNLLRKYSQLAPTDIKPPAVLTIAATAPNFGVAWAEIKTDESPQDISLLLKPAEPILGRIVNVDGQPVAGVKLGIDFVQAAGAKTIDEYLAAAPQAQGMYRSAKQGPLFGALPGRPPGMKAIVTDDDGRFRIDGLAPESLIQLTVRGDGLFHGWFEVINRPTPDGSTKSGGAVLRDPPKLSIYYASFTHVAPPGRTIRGVVRDAETGDPIEGATAQRYFTNRENTPTDADGRYEIPGALKTSEYRLVIHVEDSVHFHKVLMVKNTPGLGPIDVDPKLVRGAVVRGRVIDKESGAPVPGGFVVYNALYPNPYVDRLGEKVSSWAAARTKVEADGSFKIPVLPGPGVVAVSTLDPQFVSATVDTDRLRELVGENANEFDRIEMLHVAAGGEARTGMSVKQYKGIALINPKDGTDPAPVGLLLNRAISGSGRIVDSRGNSVDGVMVSGLRYGSTYFTLKPLDSNVFTVSGFAPGKQQTVLFHHKQKNLGAAAVVSGDDLKPMTVTLEPCASVTGRLLDRLGEPIENAQVEFHRTEPLVIGYEYWTARTDKGGRFRIDGLIGRHSYYTSVHLPSTPPYEHSSLSGKNISFEPSETKDLGDLKRGPRGRFVGMKAPAEKTPAKPRRAKTGPAKAAPGAASPVQGAGNKVLSSDVQ